MIVYDGLIVFRETMSPQSIQRALRVYVHAVDRGTLIRSLGHHVAAPPPAALADLQEILGPWNGSSSSGAAPAIPRPPAPAPVPIPATDAPTRANLTFIRHATLESNSRTGPSMWVCRRLDYTEEKNPHHIVMISDSSGRFVGPVVFPCQALVPTVAEYADLVAQGIRANQGKKPTLLCIDAIEQVDAFAALLREFDTGVNVMYYPPPSAEEQLHSNLTNPYLRGELCCAVCGVPKYLTASMMVCSRCKKAYYCSRQHQKAHWNLHKKTCAPQQP